MFVKSLFGPIAMLYTFIFGCGLVLLLIPIEESLNQVPLPEAASVEIVPIDETPQVEEVAEEHVFNQSFGGWYLLETFKGMNEVDLISINLQINYETGKIDDEYSGGSVFTSFEKYGDEGVIGHKWSKFAMPNVEFQTKKINGFDYRFTGVFFKNRTNGENGEKLLRGTLKKFKNGKKVAEAKGDFAYYEPHCWH